MGLRGVGDAGTCAPSGRNVKSAEIGRGGFGTATGGVVMTVFGGWVTCEKPGMTPEREMGVTGAS